MKFLLLAQLLLAAGILYIFIHPHTTSSTNFNDQTAIYSLQSHQTDQNQTKPSSPTTPSKENQVNGTNNHKPDTPPKNQPPSSPTNSSSNSTTKSQEPPLTPPVKPNITQPPRPNPPAHPPQIPIDPNFPPVGPSAAQYFELTRHAQPEENEWKGQPPAYTEFACSQRDQRSVMLCKLGMKKHCQTKYISEVMDTWWMVCPIYTANVQQTHLLYQLHRNFKDYVTSYGISFQTVEVIFPGQQFQLTKPDNAPYDLQYKDEWIFAMRENLVNVGTKHLPEDWQYLGWIDQHVHWEDPYWFEKSVWLFEHYNVVHLLNATQFLTQNNATEGHLLSFGMLYARDGMDFTKTDPRQCGMAWGARREIFEKVGGLLDVCIGTLCDLYQNFAYVGLTRINEASGQEYINALLKWQNHAMKVYDKKMGYLDSKLLHFKHCLLGCQTSSYYTHVHALASLKYNPEKDLSRDSEGRLSMVGNLPLAKRLWQLYGGAPRSLRRF